MLLWTFVYKFLCGYVFLFLLNIYIYMHMYIYKQNCWVILTLCLTLWSTSRLFSKVPAPFYIPTSDVWRFWFLYIFANNYLSFWIIAILVGVRWYLTVVLIGISLVANVEYHFCISNFSVLISNIVNIERWNTNRCALGSSMIFKSVKIA